jgi:hypothetical protein
MVVCACAHVLLHCVAWQGYSRHWSPRRGSRVEGAEQSWELGPLSDESMGMGQPHLQASEGLTYSVSQVMGGTEGGSAFLEQVQHLAAIRMQALARGHLARTAVTHAVAGARARGAHGDGHDNRRRAHPQGGSVILLPTPTPPQPRQPSPADTQARRQEGRAYYTMTDLLHDCQSPPALPLEHGEESPPRSRSKKRPRVPPKSALHNPPQGKQKAERQTLDSHPHTASLHSAPMSHKSSVSPL